MTRKDQTDRVFALIGVIKTLVDNFSLNTGDLWDNFTDSMTGWKGFDSPIDFIIAVLEQMGVTKMDILDYLITTIFNTPNTASWYERLGEIDPGRCTFVENVEDAVKPIIANVLTAILSCSVNPIIPGYATNRNAGIVVNREMIDLNGLLDVNPASEAGKCYYNTKNYNTDSDNSGVSDEESSWKYLNRYEMFMTYDMNAFIWHSLYVKGDIFGNFGNGTNPTECWDNRRSSTNQRTSYDKWNTFMQGCTGSGADFAYYKAEGLTPILNITGDPDTIKMWLDDHYNGRTIYEFNRDYLDSIRIFEPKIILTSLIDSFANGAISVTTDAVMGLSIVKTYIQGAVSKAVRNAIIMDDYTVNDCFYEFDNEFWLNMLDKNELQKYGAKMYGLEGQEAVEVDRKNLIDDINEAYSKKTDNSRTEKIKGVIYDVIGTPATSDSAMYEFGGLDYNNEWLTQIITSIIMPFVNAILSPQVMLLFYINLDVMGLIDHDYSDKSFNNVMGFVFKKIFAIIFDLITTVKNMVIDYLMGLFKARLAEYMKIVVAFLLLEKNRIWIDMLMDAIACFGRNSKIVASIDEVNYADIIPLQNVPENNAGKCDI